MPFSQKTRISMDSWIHPAIIFFLGSLILPFFKGTVKKFVILLIPVLAIFDVAYMKTGFYGAYHFINMDIVLAKVDKLSMVFAWVFAIMSFLGSLYALHRNDD